MINILCMWLTAIFGGKAVHDHDYPLAITMGVLLLAIALLVVANTVQEAAKEVTKSLNRLR